MQDKKPRKIILQNTLARNRVGRIDFLVTSPAVTIISTISVYTRFIWTTNSWSLYTFIYILVTVCSCVKCITHTSTSRITSYSTRSTAAQLGTIVSVIWTYTCYNGNKVVLFFYLKDWFIKTEMVSQEVTFKWGILIILIWFNSETKF